MTCTVIFPDHRSRRLGRLDQFCQDTWYAGRGSGGGGQYRVGVAVRTRLSSGDMTRDRTRRQPYESSASTS
jgi:hypothetical protein